MPQTNALFTAGDLTEWLHKQVTEAEAVIAERVVWGWLRPLVKAKYTDRPADLDEELFAWALELGGIAHTNPEGLAAYQLEAESTTYSSERRDELLGIVKAWAESGEVTPAGTVPKPRGSFPKARAYPDPAERCWS